MRIIEDAVKTLIKNEPFYGYFLTGIRRIVTRDIPTAGVSVTDKINLYLNPDFFQLMSESERVAILKHEANHVLGMHMSRKKHRTHKGFNVAADIAINQYIPNLPKRPDMSCLDTSIFPNPVKEKENAEYYYDQLQQQKDDFQKKYGKDGDEMETTDDHSIWEESTASEEEMEDVVKRAAKDAKDKAKGSVPGEVQGMLDGLFAPKINWEQKLAQFFQASLRHKKETSRKKRNRRYGIVYAGKKRDDKLRIYIAVDTSGSVSDEELKLFFSEIKGIVTKTDASVKVLIADAQIQTTYEFDGKSEIKIAGRGGTAYQPALDYANEAHETVDGLIYFGDGDAFDTPIKPSYPVLWAFTRQATNPFTFGKFIKVDEGV